MSFLTDIRIALASLRATRVRTMLTMLGIVIGVACITTVIALGEGAKNAIGSSISQMGNNIITIRPGKADRDQNGTLTNYNLLAALGATTLTERDFNTVRDSKGVQAAAPMMLVTGSVRAGDKLSQSAQIIASNGSLLPILKMKMADGDFLNENIDRNTAVISENLAEELYGTPDALGQKIILRGQEFAIVGILKKNNAPTSLSGYDINKAVFVRLDAGKAFNQGIAQIQQIMIQAPNQAAEAPLAKQLQQKLLANHGGEEDFAVLGPKDTDHIADSTLRVVTAITSAIASISIIVGGVGIMNIMLVSVTERTREIGIRKSVGATNHQVMRQFLIEALVMSIGGGIVGIIFAYVIAFLISIQFGFFPGFSIGIVIISLAVATLTGAIFGSYPAIKAARKDPIDALRQFQ